MARRWGRVTTCFTALCSERTLGLGLSRIALPWCEAWLNWRCQGAQQGSGQRRAFASPRRRRLLEHPRARTRTFVRAFVNLVDTPRGMSRRIERDPGPGSGVALAPSWQRIGPSTDTE